MRRRAGDIGAVEQDAAGAGLELAREDFVGHLLAVKLGEGCFDFVALGEPRDHLVEHAGEALDLVADGARAWQADREIPLRDFAGGGSERTASGIMNSGSALAAIVSPVVAGYLIDRTGNWQLPFVGSMLLMGVGVLLAYRMRPDRKFE